MIKRTAISSRILLRVLTGVACLFAPQSAQAVECNVTGKVITVEGHENPVCRRIIFKRNDNGQYLTFRIPGTGTDQSIVSIALTALTTNISVTINYDTTLTTGCGAEPRVIYITAIKPGHEP